jgi:hypothetical protein
MNALRDCTTRKSAFHICKFITGISKAGAMMRLKGQRKHNHGPTTNQKSATDHDTQRQIMQLLESKGHQQMQDLIFLFKSIFLGTGEHQ